MYRAIRHFGLPALVVLLLALGAAEARAMTQTNAMSKAANEQAFDCAGGNPFLYKCTNAYLVYPMCRNTGVDQPGRTQWICGGVFERRRYLKGPFQECNTQYDFSPWGHVMNYPTYWCHAPMESGDHR